MSLIVSRASRGYVLQVSGRPSSGTLKQNILYAARNGIATLGYAGLDRIGSLPAAQWLAEALRPPRDLGAALRALADGLSRVQGDAEWSREWLGRDFDVHAVGWQWSRNRSRPIVAGVSKAPGSTAFRVEYLPRYWHFDRGRPTSDGRRGFRFNVMAAPDTLISRTQLQEVVRRIRDLAPDQAEAVLCEAVGPGCLSVLLYPPETLQGRVRFLPGQRLNGRAPLHWGESPWLVGPQGIARPAMLHGKSEIVLGSYAVSLEGPTVW